jgi:hypothetical protein
LRLLRAVSGVGKYGYGRGFRVADCERLRVKYRVGVVGVTGAGGEVLRFCYRVQFVIKELE